MRSIKWIHATPWECNVPKTIIEMPARAATWPAHQIANFLMGSVGVEPTEGMTSQGIHGGVIVIKTAGNFPVAIFKKMH